MLEQRPQLIERVIAGHSQRGHAIERPQIIFGKRNVRADHHAPAVPGQNLHLVERHEIADQVAEHEPETVHVEDAERVRVGLTGATHLPRMAAGDETVARHVERGEGDAEHLALECVELCVHQNPAGLFSIPILANPVILEVIGQEVRAEPAAGAGGDERTLLRIAPQELARVTGAEWVELVSPQTVEQ